MSDILARLTISRLTLYVLLALLGAAFVLTIVGALPYRPLDLGFSTLLILFVCWAVNRVFARGFGASSNWESVLITGLILTLIITPFSPADGTEIGFAIFAAAWAMASKYIVVLRGRHVFNPAAFGVALAAAALGASVSWWVGGSLYLLGTTLLGGLLILRKMRCYNLLFPFSGACLATVVVTSGWGHAAAALDQLALHSMFFFFAFVMLTEPRTAPLGQARRVAYAALTGILFAPEVHWGTFYSTPELALLAGNLFTVLSSPRRWAARRPALNRATA